MSKNLSMKYYQKRKKVYKRKFMKDTKIFLAKKKKESEYMVVNFTRISQKIKRINWFNIAKKYYRMRKNALL